MLLPCTVPARLYHFRLQSPSHGCRVLKYHGWDIPHTALFPSSALMHGLSLPAEILFQENTLPGPLKMTVPRFLQTMDLPHCLLELSDPRDLRFWSFRPHSGNQDVHNQSRNRSLPRLRRFHLNHSFRLFLPASVRSAED